MPPQILVIDDEPDMLALLRTLLLGAGYDVAVAANARGALEYLVDHRPDLILTDIFMPDGDGFDLIGVVRRSGLGIPIIAISGGATPIGADPLDIARQLGAVPVAKPFRAQELLDTVKRMIGGGQRETPDGNESDGR
jgi:CheY-like chemotaxis protein